jgi:hypothetical protein
MSEGFRNEIIENQKARIDLVKWKLIIVAAVFAWSLDKGASSSQQLSYWAISLVPFVCLFVDSQCFHINLRTFVIAQFLRDHAGETDQSKYENFVHDQRINLQQAKGQQNADQSGDKWQWLIRQVLPGDMFQLEQGVLTWSTVGLCIAVFFWPNVAKSFGNHQEMRAPVTTAMAEQSAPTVASCAPSARPSGASPHARVNVVRNETGRAACRVSGAVGLIFSIGLFWLYNGRKQKTWSSATTKKT